MEKGTPVNVSGYNLHTNQQFKGQNTVFTITREEAAAQGWKNYFTGKPCRRGHNAQRYVSTGTCVDCQRAAASAQRGKRAPIKPPGAVEFRVICLPAEAEQICAWLDQINAQRGWGPALRPEPDMRDATPWEQYLALERRRGVPLETILQAAPHLGVVEAYSPGNARPVDSWSQAPDEVVIRHRARGRDLTAEEIQAINVARTSTGRPAL